MSETFTVVILAVSGNGQEAYFRRGRHNYGIDIFPAIEGVKPGMKMEITWDRPSFVPDFSLCGAPYGPIQGARLVN
jgi:hypothetical protein